MDIRTVRKTFQHFGTLSILQLAQLTKESPEDLSFVVHEFIQRKKVEKVPPAPSCGGGSCSCSSTAASSCFAPPELYRWIE